MKPVKETAAKVKAAAGRFIRQEDGVGVVEIILILVVLVALVLIFEDEVTSVVEDALDAFSEDASGLYE